MDVVAGSRSPRAARRAARHALAPRLAALRRPRARRAPGSGCSPIRPSSSRAFALRPARRAAPSGSNAGQRPSSRALQARRTRRARRACRRRRRRSACSRRRERHGPGREPALDARRRLPDRPPASPRRPRARARGRGAARASSSAVMPPSDWPTTTAGAESSCSIQSSASATNASGETSRGRALAAPVRRARRARRRGATATSQVGRRVPLARVARQAVQQQHRAARRRRSRPRTGALRRDPARASARPQTGTLALHVPGQTPGRAPSGRLRSSHRTSSRSAAINVPACRRSAATSS